MNFTFTLFPSRSFLLNHDFHYMDACNHLTPNAW